MYVYNRRESEQIIFKEYIPKNQLVVKHYFLHFYLMNINNFKRVYSLYYFLRLFLAGADGVYRLIFGL